MKRLSDYKGDEAFELWADLLEPITEILGDGEIAEVLQSNKPTLIKASIILKKYKKEAMDIMLRIDPEPIDGLNVIVRLASILVEIGQRDDIRGFFGFAGQAEMENVSSGFVTESTGAEEK